MRSSLSTASLLLLLNTVLLGQAQSFSDTLDWRRYFPLEIGNEWQYRLDSEPFERDQFITWKIEGDTLIEQVSYFTLRRVYYDSNLDVRIDHNFHIRYDTLSASVVRFGRYSDGRISETPVWLIPCGLDADFNASKTCSTASQTSYGVSGDYGANVTVGSDVFPAAAFKIYGSLGGSSTMVSDIGMVERWPEASVTLQRLEYVKIGDIRYGSPVITVSKEQGLLARAISLSVYPNPFSEQTTIRFSLSKHQHVELQIFDTLGRHVKTVDLGLMPSGEHRRSLDLSGQPNGTYFLQVKTLEGYQIPIPAIKIL